MEVYHKGGSNANGRTSIFNVNHDYVKKVVPERKQCLGAWDGRAGESLSYPGFLNDNMSISISEI